MNKQKLISVLQSRIAKRRMLLASYWELFEELVEEGSSDSEPFKVHLLKMGTTQKEDKQILKQLVEDERGIRKWKKAFAEADLMLWELQQREG